MVCTFSKLPCAVDTRGEDCDVLLSTENTNSMRTLAWTRTYRDPRVFCKQLGHDPRTWEHLAFGRLVRNGLLWCADHSLTAA